MVSNCANPECFKPLLYLREGKIFIFDRVDPGSANSGLAVDALEYFWLCGKCASIFLLQQGRNQDVELVVKSEIRPAQRSLPVDKPELVVTAS